MNKNTVLELESVCKDKDVREILQIGLTANGRISNELGFYSLSSTEKFIFNMVMNPKVVLKNYFVPTGSNKLSIAINEYGKLMLRLNSSLNRNDVLLYETFVTQIFIDLVNQNTRKELANNEKYLKEIDEFYEHMDLIKIVDDVEEELNHIAPLLWYIDDTIYTSLGKHNNLLKKSGSLSDDYILSNLKKLELSKWSLSEKKLIYFAYVLLQSGTSYRVEEMNGFHLSYETLFEFFEGKLQKYSEVLGVYFEANTSCSLLDKAKKVNKLFIRVSEKMSIYREITGINLNKKEVLIKFSNIENEEIYKGLSSVKLYDFFIEHLEKNDIDFLHNSIMDILEEYREIIDADIVTARGFRNPYRLVQLIRNNEIENICLLKQDDFFCAIKVKKIMYEQIPNNILSKIFISISSRLTYNSWHYIPGNFAKDYPDLNYRHYYIPPRIPDIASNSDEHHAGHVHASIKNTIRYPRSIKILGKEYDGLIDIRAIRRKGARFTKKELEWSRKYSYILQILFQALFDLAVYRNFEFEISEYTSEWYKERL